MELDVWTLLGLLAQALFFGRFVAQWVASERRQEVTIPEIFWYFSIMGGSLLLLYAVHRRDLVFVLGQAGGLFIYVRNLVLLRRSRSKA